MDNEGLRLGMFLGGLVMAAVPVAFGVWGIIFLFKEFRKERSLAERVSDEGGAP